MITYTSPQGSPEWLAERRGVITGSRFADARAKPKSGAPSKDCLNYAMDLARERIGGSVMPTFANAAMRMGTEQEPFARMAYERDSGTFVIEAGFIATDDRKFGVSVDGLIDDLGIYECKTMVSSATLFKAVVKGDISAYTDQCEGCMWLLQRDWVDLHLWVPDLPQFSKVIRITRDDDRIETLEKDLLWFDGLVSEFESQLRKVAPAPATATTF